MTQNDEDWLHVLLCKTMKKKWTIFVAAFIEEIEEELDRMLGFYIHAEKVNVNSSLDKR